jgi:CubicO group peptidase (beta-lactamase class C family)
MFDAAAFVLQPIRFTPFCFQGEKFPPCDFDQPRAVRELIGPYKIKVAYFNAKGRKVEKAAALGRYGAVVDIRHRRRTSRRFVTLCRVGGPEGQYKGFLSPGGFAAAGIDPQVLASRNEQLRPPGPDKWNPTRLQATAEAMLVASLFDLTALKKAGKKLPADTLVQIDRQWWVDFKRRYYSYDKKYPKAFTCPQTLKGKRAPTIRAGTAAQAGMKGDAIKTIGKACQAWTDASQVGCALCVVRGGVMVMNQAFGKISSGPCKGMPFAPETVAPLASTTKFFTAIMLSMFADQGMIGLDDPVEKYVAALGKGGRRKAEGGSKKAANGQPKVIPTIRDLLLHTAGFTGHWGDLEHDLEEMVADMYPTLPVRERHQYQGVGHALAGKIMEMISGESIPRLFRNYLFEPLGCTGMQSDLTSYGALGTTHDLAKIGQMMLNGGSYGTMRFTGPAAIAQLMPIPGNDRFAPDKSIRWGMGMKLFDSDGMSEQSFGHSGATGSFLKIDPAYDLVIAHTRFEEGPDYHKQRAILTKAILASIGGTR